MEERDCGFCIDIARKYIPITSMRRRPIVSSESDWLLLLAGLPAKQASARVTLWRELRRCGALPFKTSASLLPNRPEHRERLQWLAQQVRDSGGDATVLRVAEIDGLATGQVVQLFNRARTADYDELLPALLKFFNRNKRRLSDTYPQEMEKLRRQFEDIRRIDFFDCPRGREVQATLDRVNALRVPNSLRGATRRNKLRPRDFLGRTWLTRPRPEIDRVGSAWLIRKHIDRRARFVFASDIAAHPEALPFDIVGVEFSHHGDDCSFETLVVRFGIEDRIVRRIAEIVHDADLEDGKFQTNEGFGLQRMLRGWARAGLTDEELLKRGFECFDALASTLER